MNLQEIKKELLGLSVSGVFRMPIMQRWLLKYSDLYKNTYESFYSKHLYTDHDGSTIRLPPLGKPTDEENFLYLYESLIRISDLHANEIYFEQEMVEYDKIKNSPFLINTWIAKNAIMGAKEYVCFMIDYLDYDENGHEEHLKVYIQNLKELEIFIDRQDFKNTICFLEIFNEFYWNKDFISQK